MFFRSGTGLGHGTDLELFITDVELQPQISQQPEELSRQIAHEKYAGE